MQALGRRAVLATARWAAMQGRKKLKWNGTRARTKFLTRGRTERVGGDGAEAGKVIREVGTWMKDFKAEK